MRSSSECIPNVVAEKDDNGMIVTGDSGDELGEGSVKDDESAVEIVVVGDESVDSEVCVDVLSRCWCCVGLGLSISCGDWFAFSPNESNLLIVAATSRSSMLWSNPYTVMNVGKWLSYACGPAATGIFGD